MKNSTIKHLTVILLLLASLPATGQDFLNIYFKDGTFRIFHFDSFESLRVSKIDADGVAHEDYQYQHVLSGGKEFVYNLADIDSISFTKYNEQKVETNVSDAMSTILPELKSCKTFSEMAEKLEAINQTQGVEKAWVDGDFIYVKIRDWETIVFSFQSYVDEPEMEDMAETAQQVLQTMSAPQQVNNKDGVQLKAVVANAQNDEGVSQRVNDRKKMNNLVSNFNSAGFYGVYEDVPDLDFFLERMYDYDVVLLSTHGGYNASDRHILLTGQSFGIIDVNASADDYRTWCNQVTEEYETIFANQKYNGFRDDMFLATGFKEIRETSDGSLREYYAAKIIIKESFFTKVNRTFNNRNSILFNAACQSMKGNNEQESNSLANILRNRRGLGTYLGYTEENVRGQRGGCIMLNEMLCGVSADKAYQNLGINQPDSEDYPTDTNDGYHITGNYKDEEARKTTFMGLWEVDSYVARLKMLPEGSNCFITPVYTRERSHDEVMSSYNTDGSVMVSATTTTLDPNKISMGFKYGTNKNAMNGSVSSEMVMKTIDNGQGNYLITSHLRNLEAGKTYYYCGYTYDGEYYNYGDTLSFSIDAPVVVTNSARVKSILLTKATYRPNGYEFNGAKYSFSYNVSATAEITGANAPVEWGFDVMGPDGYTVVRHRAVDDNTNNPWAFLVVSNTPNTVLQVRAYAIWQQGGEATVGEWQTFDLLYSTNTSLQLTDVTFSGTTQGAVYNGEAYKYKSSFRFVYTVTGGYWQQVSPKEEGSGWENWPLPERSVRPADGANATTINYYYNDHSFTGDYLVRLQSIDATHNTRLQSNGYAKYLHNGTTFTGCTYFNGTSATPAYQAPAQSEMIFDNGEINIVIP